MSFSYNPFTDNLDYKATSSGGTVTSVTGTANRITTTGTVAVVVDIAATYIGQASITTLGTITTGTWNASIIPLAYGGTNANLTASNGGILYSTASAVAILAGTATANRVLMSGSSTTPAWSTATYPATAGTSGKVLISNGTNIVSSTPTFPNASATSGKFIQSDGTNWIASTPTLPTTGGTTGTILRSNGTNFVNTTATYPTTTTLSQILYSSSANVIGGITTANNSILSTDASGIPSMGTSLSNDYTFTSATASASRALTVSNTDNTSGSSTAIMSMTVGGTSAGDAYNRYAIGTTQSYAVGIDNSDTQSFVVNGGASGTTGPSTGSRLMRIDTTGNVSKPLNACCTADLNTGLTNATGDGTFVNPIIFDTDSGSFFDQNGNYNTTTGIFTANATGKYLVNATVTFNNIAVGHTSGIVRINLNGAAYAINDFSPYTIQNINNTCSVSISCILPVAATGTIAILAQVSGSTKTVGIKGETSGSFTRLSIVLVS